MNKFVIQNTECICWREPIPGYRFKTYNRIAADISHITITCNFTMITLKALICWLMLTLYQPLTHLYTTMTQFKLLFNSRGWVAVHVARFVNNDFYIKKITMLDLKSIILFVLLLYRYMCKIFINTFNVKMILFKYQHCTSMYYNCVPLIMYIPWILYRNNVEINVIWFDYNI